MNLFEYLTVAVSIVLSMSIVRSLESFGDVVDPQRRDPIHVTWFALKASQPALMWWSIWGLHDQTAWNYAAFLLCLAGPIFLFFQVTTLTTREPDEVEDWGAHFMRCRRRFFSANIALAGSGPALVAVLGDTETARVLIGGVTLEIVVSVVGISTTNRRVHQVLAALIVTSFALWSVLLFEPV
ncbi:MAG: hypothetical protein NXI30_19070 [bacterium]|nr:hypothetical protein [bacterium]